jgi:hypothetical protein
VVVFLSASLAACVAIPDPPPRPADLSGLVDQYDHPRAAVPMELVQRLLDEGRRRAEFGELIGRLHFVGAAVSEASTGIGARTNIADLELQGRVDATLPCPGDAPMPSTDANVNGSLHLKFGVENSALQRGFQGTAEQCRLYVATRTAPPQRVVVSAALTGDLGGDLHIGNTLPTAILLQLNDIVGTSMSAVGTFQLPPGPYDFRLAPGDALEILLNPASFGLPDLGTVVFVARADGSFGLREIRGEWICGGGGEACVLQR